ncbi:enoyl-CoA hydratase-related protein [Actinocorallia sp. API 0066]|uniref:enoyl-CoA hydratase/isomerase family protein n=1 Tax=Actinocorallia sp. API 0066 TaxID=2896846 RepID=UPI001E455448|nr:enoyl-CoA hydratase-related protein [Actinocorallia sp. API 0066]MCD0448198.1 enoyl-CoA hydratase-related protein [Actinocorallia sp. API 0066]
MVAFTRRDGVATITLSRPERLNAITPENVEELIAILGGLKTDRETRVVILTGEGRGFCAGMDIQGGGGERDTSEVSEGKIQRLYRGMARAGEVVLGLREIPQPVVAALRGPVVGMAFSLALACDLRVAAPSTRFTAPFLNLGFSAGDLGLTWLLPRLIGTARAGEIFYRAQKVDAERALDLGLVTEIAEDDVAGAEALARELLDRSPFGLRHTKELLNLSLDAPGLRTHLAVENRTQTLAFLTEDLAEGITATMEKRPPRFRDR